MPILSNYVLEFPRPRTGVDVYHINRGTDIHLYVDLIRHSGPTHNRTSIDKRALEMHPIVIPLVIRGDVKGSKY